MEYEIIKTELYILLVNDEQINEGDYIVAGTYNTITKAKQTPVSIAQKKIIAHFSLYGSPIIEGIALLTSII